MANKSTPIVAKFQFVGGAQSGRGTTIDWPLEVQGVILRAYFDGGQKAKEIFAGILPLLNEERAKAGLAAVEELPKSYSNNNAGSLLHGMRARFLERCQKGDKETIAVAEKYKLIEPKSDAATS